MPSTLPPTRRARRARGPAHLAVALGLLLSLIGQAHAQIGFEAGVSKFHTPTWGTNPNPAEPGKSGRIWDIAVWGDVAYIGGEFTSLAPSLELAGALDGASGFPMPGFPKIDNGLVNVAVPDDEGGWYVGGSFQKINGVTRNGLARVRADGTVDTNWDPPLAGLNQGPFTVWAMAKRGPHVYLGGEFTRFARKEFPGGGFSPAYTRNHLAKVSSSSGTVDGAWDPNANGTVRSIAVSPDGARVYIAGDFTALKGGSVPRNRLAALNAMGAGDVLEWQPGVGGVSALTVSPDSSRVYLAGDTLAAVDLAGAPVWPPLGGGKVKSLALSRDGTVLYAGGDFTALGGQPRIRLAAVDTASGTLDAAWNPGANGAVSSLTISEDGTKVYVGGNFGQVRGRERNNLAAIDALTGSLEAWNPNANGAVAALAASGSQVYAGGNFANLGAQPRTMLGAIDMGNGGALNWAPQLQNLDGSGNPLSDPPVVQALVLSEDGSRVFIGGNFSHVNGEPKKHLVAVSRATGEIDRNFNPGTVQGTVRSLAIYRNTLYVGGDFKSVRVSGSEQGTGRPDNPCPAGQRDCSPLGVKGNSSAWSRPGLMAAFDATTGYLELDFDKTPESVGPGLIGQGGKECTPGMAGCGNGAMKSIVISADGRYLYAGGTFSDLGGQLGLIATNRVDGSFTAWQPDITIPIFDLDLFKGDGKSLFTAAGGAGGRIQRFLPHEGPVEPVWQHTFDGDSVAVDSSLTTVYSAGHYDFVDGGVYKRKHASAFNINGEIAINFDPELDTSTGPFTVEVAPRHVVYGGEFSRVNRRPQPGFAMFAGTP